MCESQLLGESPGAYSSPGAEELSTRRTTEELSPDSKLPSMLDIGMDEEDEEEPRLPTPRRLKRPPDPKRPAKKRRRRILMEEEVSREEEEPPPSATLPARGGGPALRGTARQFDSKD